MNIYSYVHMFNVLFIYYDYVEWSETFYMFLKTRNAKKINILQKSIDKLTNMLQDMNIHDLIYIFGSKKEIIKRNLLAGIARGIGGGIGFTIITAIIIYFLQRIVRLNIPIIGEYINDIIDIVQKTN